MSEEKTPEQKLVASLIEQCLIDPKVQGRRNKVERFVVSLSQANGAGVPAKTFKELEPALISELTDYLNGGYDGRTNFTVGEIRGRNVREIYTFARAPLPSALAEKAAQVSGPVTAAKG